MTRIALALIFFLFLPGCVQPIDAPSEPVVQREHLVQLQCQTAPFEMSVALYGDELAAQLSWYFESPTAARARAFLSWVRHNQPELMPTATHIVALVSQNCPAPAGRAARSP